MQSLLAIIIGLLWLSLLTRESDAACSETNPCVKELGQGQPFQEPDQIDTTTFRNIKLNIDITEIKFGWLKLKRRTYNGKVIGSTWIIKKGTHFAVTVNNRLSSLNNEQDKPEGRMNRPNTTNIHTHGLHISSNSPQDNVGISILPGQQYVYRFQIHEKHPSGTYWYHAHVHGSTMFQVQSGMAGLLIVKDHPRTMEYKLRKASCPYNCDADIQMIIQGLLQFNNRFMSFGLIQDEIEDDPLFRQDSIMTSQNISLREWLATNVNLMTVNGLLQPVLTLKEGKMYRFRMANAAGFDTIELLITNKGTNQSADGCEIREIAYDGIYLDKPRKPHQGQSFLSSGNRVDWLVKCNKPGEYELRSYANPNNSMSTGVIFRWSGLLVSIKVKRRKRHYYGYYDNQYRRDEAQHLKTILRARDSDRKTNFFKWILGLFRHEDAEFKIRLPKRPSFVRDLRQVRGKDIKERFVMEFDTGLQMNRERWTTPDNFRYALTVNNVQEWHVVNTDNHDSHPFHPHTNSFQVISYNNYTGPYSIRFSEEYVLYNQDDKKPCHYQRAGLSHVIEEPMPSDALRFLGHDERYRKNEGNTLGYVRVGDWRDTLLVPPLSNITIRFMPDRYTGSLIIHCHLLAHEDAGMMMIAKIVKKGESLAANITSGNAFPGTCRRCDRYPSNNPKALCELNQNEISLLSKNMLTNQKSTTRPKVVRNRHGKIGRRIWGRK